MTKATPLAAPEGWQLVPKAELTRIARLIEDLKQPCGFDPESPRAIQNGRYMSIAAILRDLAAAPGAAVPPVQEPVAWQVAASFWQKRESIPKALQADAVPLYTTPTAAESAAVRELVEGLEMLLEFPKAGPATSTARSLLSKYAPTADQAVQEPK